MSTKNTLTHSDSGGEGGSLGDIADLIVALHAADPHVALILPVQGPCQGVCVLCPERHPEQGPILRLTYLTYGDRTKELRICRCHLSDALLMASSEGHGLIVWVPTDRPAVTLADLVRAAGARLVGR